MTHKFILPLITVLILVFISCGRKDSSQKTMSPDEKISIVVGTEKGCPYYEVFYNEKPVIDKSMIGFEFKNTIALNDSLKIVKTETRSFDETWKPVYGTDEFVRNRFNETVFTFEEYTDPGRSFKFMVRAYNDGVAFRYVLPENFGDSLLITEENTMFRFAGNDTAWWIPSDEFAYESLYRNNLLSEIKDAATPLTISCKNGLFLSVHEAALLDYSEMYLENAGQNSPDFFVSLWPEPDSVCARVKTPFQTPWRVVLISETAGGLIESHLVQNLNEPCAIDDVSWIKPLKFTGVWWGMHLGKYTWYEGEKHGATTERTKEYAGFASKHKMSGVLAEGWNKGWETWASGVKPVQDFCTAYSDFDLDEVLKYCRENNVEFICHHETGGNIPEYERQLDSALALCKAKGIHYLKTGYAGPIIPEGYPHHGQYMVRHFQKVVETAAKYQVCLDVHESIKPTGIERTWPNLMTQEAARGNEWNATYKATPPYHATILPFTRFIAGPYDYTPGIFKIIHSPESNKRLYCTRTYQMAMYVVFYSPMMMVSDMIENYENCPEFGFIEDVPCTWDQTKVVDARLGDFVSIARRSGDKWYIGSIADENCHLVKIPLSFLNPEKTYVADIYCDAVGTDWETNPEEVEICSHMVSSGDTIYAALSKAGGHTVIIRPVDAVDILLPDLELYNRESCDKMKVFEKQKTYGENSENHLAKGKPVSFVNIYSSKYPASGKNALTDGIKGTYNINENWQGFEGTDMEAVIDLGRDCKIKSVKAGFLDSPNDWIFYPEKVIVYISEDGKNYVKLSEIPIKQSSPENAKVTSVQEIASEFKETTARYVKVKAVNTGICPDWHYAKGKPAWLFCDEIVVE